MPQVFGRKSSRNSNSLRKISHPEETIHCSSEKDERIEYTTTDPLLTEEIKADSTPKENKETDEEKIKNYFKQFNAIIIYMEIAQSQMDITNHKHLSKDKVVDYTRFTLPRIVLKSSFAEYITRSSLRLKVNPPLNTKTTFNWTIQFLDLSIETSINDQLFAVLQPWQTTVTVAMNKRKQNPTIPTNLSQYTSPTFKSNQQQQSSPRSNKPKSKNPISDHASKSHENSSVSSGSLKEIFSGSEHCKDSSSATPSLPKVGTKPAANAEGCPSGDKVVELICLNLHLDSSTVYMYANNINTLQNHFQHFINVLDLASVIFVAKRDTASARSNKQPVKILTLTEDHHHIKEFMDLDSNSDISSKPANECK